MSLDTDNVAINKEPQTVDFRDRFYLLWHWAWLILLVGVLAGVIAYGINEIIPPVYETTTQLLIVENPAPNLSQYEAVLTSEHVMTTYAQMMTNKLVLQSVINSMGLPFTLDQMSKAISVTPITDTQMIQVKVSGNDPVLIAKIANTLIKNFIIQIKPIQTANIVQVDEALPPLIPVSPKKGLNSAISALVAVFLAAGGILAFDAFDDTLRTPDTISTSLGLPVLGVIVHYELGSKPITQEQPNSPISEAFRNIRTNLEFSKNGKPLRTIVVTSPSPGEGKTLVSANLAVAFAQGGKNVILMEADLRGPTIHKWINLSTSHGLSSMLMQNMADLNLTLEGLVHRARILNSSTRPVVPFQNAQNELQDKNAVNIISKADNDASSVVLTLNSIVRKTETEGLFMITSGNFPPNPTELLGSEKMDLILKKLEDDADIIIIDTPPTLPVSDTMALANKVDGVLLVIRPGITTLTAARQALMDLRRVNARIIGIVLNNIDLRKSGYKYYYGKDYKILGDYLHRKKNSSRVK
jgi:polysaccharide biosynthesis transport protein